MDPQIKKQWIDALRSGKYTQGIEALYDGTNHCVLGVLSDLHAKATGGEWTHPTPKKYLYHSWACALAPPVRSWAGIKGIFPKVTVGGTPEGLSKLNDMGSSFSELANLIEEQY